MRHFHDAALILKRRIDLMLALPLTRLDALSLQHELREIGKTGKTAAV
jgi:arsenate reductase